MSQDVVSTMKREHRDLDWRIRKAGNDPGMCPFRLKEMKRQKLQLRDQLAAAGALN